MVQSRFRGKDDCVYCDQPFFVHVCLFVCLAGGVFLCSVENFYCLSSYSNILTELRPLFTASKALLNVAVYGWENTFAATK